MFGDRFLREYGSAPNDTWTRAISRLDDRLIARALANLGNDGLQHPPTLSQFVAAAKRLPPVRYLGVQTAGLLERKSSSPEARNEAMQKIREALRCSR
jgi:hypothetical protein